MTPRRYTGTASGEAATFAIIDVNPRRDKPALKEIREMEPRARAAVNIPNPRAIRYSNRSTVERVNARLKDEFGGRHARGAKRRSSRTSRFGPGDRPVAAPHAGTFPFYTVFGGLDTGRR